MATDNELQQFEIWQKKWDDAAASFAKEFADQVTPQKEEEPLSVSWLTNTPLERDYGPKEVEENPDWHDIYYRSQNIDGLITEGQIEFSKGAEKPKANFGAFTPTKRNPTSQDTTGPDGLEPGGINGKHVAVTPNWSDSDDLRELDDIKRRIEHLERKQHETEVQSEKPASKMIKELASLRDRVRKLSEKINGEPETDQT
jgi:hypothetical protein